MYYKSVMGFTVTFTTNTMTLIMFLSNIDLSTNKQQDCVCSFCHDVVECQQTAMLATTGKFNIPPEPE